MSGRTVAIIQARMTSTRLPGKSLLPLAGKPMLAHVIERARAIPGVDAVWVATTNDGSEAPIVSFCETEKIPCYRGSVDDVLSRYATVARQSHAQTIIRITADCPLLDPTLSGKVLSAFERSEPRADYASNVLERSYPRGLDTEVFSTEALFTAEKSTIDPLDREHVTRYFYTHPNQFRLIGIRGEADHSAHRWTVDTAEDFQLVSEIFARLNRLEFTSWEAALQIVQADPALATMNRHIEQKKVV